jgi:ADP-ribose pyrophosphatase
MRILKVEKITNEHWLNLFAATFENHGRQGRWLFASRKAEPYRGGGGDAVVIVPVLKVPDQPPRLVLIREFRVPVGGYSYGFPAGLIEPGESVQETVRREMLEETGFEVSAFKRVTPPLYSSSGMTDETAAMAFVDVRPSQQERPPLEMSEDISLVLLDFEGVCRLCDAPDLPIDAKAWTALYLYQQLGRLA